MINAAGPQEGEEGEDDTYRHGDNDTESKAHARLFRMGTLASLLSMRKHDSDGCEDENRELIDTARRKRAITNDAAANW